MPTYRLGKVNPRTNPWEARVKLCGVSYPLGYHPSKYEAEKVEQQFRDDLRKLNG